jgi:hypothetical protein
MFGFLSMANDYESRNVANTEIGGATIDTSAVTDSARPYETGIKHPRYNDGSWIIVELYDSKEKAELGHKKWVELFSRDELPPRLADVNESDISEMFGGIGRGEYELCPQE